MKNSEKRVYVDEVYVFFCCVFFAWSFYFFVCVLV